MADGIKLDVRIMAHPSRQSIVENTLKDLGKDASIVTYDTSGSPMNGARKAWLAPIPEGVTHRLVLQDDIEVADDLIPTIEKIMGHFPFAVLSLYLRQTFLSPEDRQTGSPYVVNAGCSMSGAGIVMPVSIIQDVFNFIDDVYGQDYKHDDCAIGMYLYLNGYMVINTIPGLVQHLCPTKSTLRGHNRAYKVSSVYAGKQGAKDVDWDNTNYIVKKTPLPPLWLDNDDPRCQRIKAMIRKRQGKL